MMKRLALLTLDEALCQEGMQSPTDELTPALERKVPRRPLAPSPACLPSRTREYVLPPPLLPGPFSILLS
jgi:hypothetical protein